MNLTIAGTQASFDVEALRTAAPGAKEWAANELKSSNLADIPPCPYLRVDESYELLTTVPYGKLSANSTWGFLRGLETLAQHSYFDPDRNLYTMSGVNVTDGPRFGVRGMLVDTARHYLPMSTLYAAFDSVAMHKMNTIHLHLTDDQTTPWIPDGHPELKKGNWGKLGNHYYSNADMRSLAKFAAFRGLAINVEIDGPGHMTAFGYGCPECIICGNQTGKGGLANVLPGSAYWDLMQDMYAQLAEIMPWGMIGLGGDEVSSQECWSKNSSIVQLAEDLNVTIGGAGPDSLMCWFHAQRLEIAEALGMQAVFWSDAAGCTNLPHVNISDPSALALAAHPKPTWETVRASAGGRLPAVMDVWRMDEYVLPQVLQRGFPAVVSSMCEYLNCSWNTEYWQNLYCDPTNTSQPVDPALMDALMLGAHASRWGEDTDATNWMANVWPAASGTAEKLWSPKDKTTPEGEGKLDPMERLRDFRCLLGTRGLPIPPIMIDHCPVPYDNGYQPLGWDEL